MDFAVKAISLDDAGAPGVAETAPGPLEALEGLGLSYRGLHDIREGLALAHGYVEAGGEVPPHAAESRYVMLVIRGTGTLTLMPEGEDEPAARVAFAPGTIIDFPPHARHGWINEGGEAFEWFGIDISG